MLRYSHAALKDTTDMKPRVRSRERDQVISLPHSSDGVDDNRQGDNDDYDDNQDSANDAKDINDDSGGGDNDDDDYDYGDYDYNDDNIDQTVLMRMMRMIMMRATVLIRNGMTVIMMTIAKTKG